MTATLATFASMLQRFYKGPVVDQLNNEIFILKYFMKQKFGWQGESVILPVRIGRNTGVGTRGEAQALPVAGRQQTANLTVNSAFIYGRFEVTGPLMASAAKGGSHAFAAAMTDEMEGLTRDIKDLADRLSISGGRIVGFINQKKDSGGTGGANSHTHALAGTGDYQYMGDLTPFLACTDNANIALWRRIRLYRTDTGAEIVPVVTASGAVATDAGIFVSAFNTNGMGTADSPSGAGPGVTLRVTADDNTVTFKLTSAPSAGNPGIPVTVGIAVALHETQAVDHTGAPYGQAVTSGALADSSAATGWPSQPMGMFGNIADPGTNVALPAPGGNYLGYWGMDRTDAANAVMRGQVLGHDVGAVGTDGDNEALELARMQQAIDSIDVETGERPDLIVMNPLGRAAYMNLLAGAGNAANLMVPGDKAGHGDGGFTGISYGGIPIHTSRHFPQCAMAFLNTKSWIVAELQGGKFADEDGNILSRVANTDAFEGFWKHYYNLVCKRPRANAILIGFLPT